MSGDLIALAVALALGAAVVTLGLRRNLSETTRNGLPSFGGDPDGASATLGLYEGEERPRRRPLSRRQRRWLVSVYLLLALMQAVSVVLSSDDRPIRLVTAALFLLTAVVLLLRKPADRSAGLDLESD